MLEAATSYYRHFYMGLIRDEVTPKLALDHFARHTPDMGMMRRFHFRDRRLGDAVARQERVGIERLRASLGRADGSDPGGPKRPGRQMAGLADFDRKAAFCFTPDGEGISPRHSSPSKDSMHSADFCARTSERCAPALSAEAKAA